MQSISTRALVLRSIRINDRQKIVVLFCEQVGKLSAFSYHSTRLTSSKIALIETGNLVDVRIQKISDSYTLKEARLISCFASIKSDSRRLNSLYQLCFALDQMLPSEQNESYLFTKTLIFLTNLSKRFETKFSTHLHFMLCHLGFEDENLTNDESSLNEKFSEITNRKLPVNFG